MVVVVVGAVVVVVGSVVVVVVGATVVVVVGGIAVTPASTTPIGVALVLLPNGIANEALPP